jgi:pyridoxal 5'-phosphate synthase pdxS subunit
MLWIKTAIFKTGTQLQKAGMVMDMKSDGKTGTFTLKKGLAEMLKGGVIMDVVSAEQAKLAEKAGAVAVMALERVPADIRKAGGVARMADTKKIKEIMNSVSIPVMAKARIGHLAEAQILESLGVDYIDESEVLTPADDSHINKHDFKVPFVCGARNLGEVLRRIQEGAAMIRTKGEPGTGNIIEAVKHMKLINEEIDSLKNKSRRELARIAKTYRVQFGFVEETKNLGRLPVVNFAAGGVATPADAALMMLLGADGLFVGSGIFKAKNPEKTAKAVVEATTHYNDPKIVAKVSYGLGDAMKGLEIEKLELKMQERGL